MARFDLDAKAIERLHEAMKNFPQRAEDIVNEVLHLEGGPLIEEEIRRLMPVSGMKWRGKKPPAKTGNSLEQVDHNLGVTIRTKGDYHYLYFPDDGTNTYHHMGNKQFFLHGAENQQDEIIERCINRLVVNIEEST